MPNLSQSSFSLLFFGRAVPQWPATPVYVPRTKEPIPVLLMGWCSSTAHNKPSCSCTFGCSLLEELDYLCYLKGLQAPPHATGSDTDTSRARNFRRFSREGWGESKCQWPALIKLFAFCCGLAFASLLHLLSLSFAPKPVKFIHNHLGFLNGQVDEPEVELTVCFTVTIKCCLII